MMEYTISFISFLYHKIIVVPNVFVYSPIPSDKHIHTEKVDKCTEFSWRCPLFVMQ